MKFNPAGMSWWQRHLTVIFISVLGSALLLYSRSEWSAMHRWNRAIGDMSLVLLAFTMMIGPMSRLWRRFSRIIPYRRELGIYAVLLALLHTTIILFGWVSLDLMRLFGFEFHPNLQQYVMLNHGFALANVIGILALLYGFVLMLTSNNLSLRWLGNNVWKYIQQGTYVLWWLSVVHTAYFLFVHFLDFHRQTPEPNWARWPFVALVSGVVALQIAASAKTWHMTRQRNMAAPDAS